MPTNIKAFTARCTSSFKEVDAAVVRLHKGIHLEGFRRIVKRTPRDTGYTVNNWQTTIGAPAGGKVGSRPTDGSRLPPPSINDSKSKLAGLAPYSISHLTNNVDHILVLEYGQFEPPNPGPSKDKRRGRKGRVLVEGGFSIQAPNGMVDITAEELRNETGLVSIEVSLGELRGGSTL